MTIGTNTARVSFVCNGVSTVFPVPIQAYAAGDFLVIATNTATGASIVLVLNSDYTLASSGTLAPTQWTLTTLTGQLASPYATGYTLQVILNPSETQQTQYVQGQQFPSLAVQTNMDRLTQMAIRLSDQMARTIIAPDGDVAPAMALPPAGQRKGTYLGFDSAAGNVSLFNILTAGTVLSAAVIGAFLYPVLGIEGGTVVNIAFPYGNVNRYGTNSVPGTTDMTTAFNNALLANGRVYAPATYGPYLISGQITLQAGNDLFGDGSATVLNFSSTANTDFIVANAISNVTVSDLKIVATGVTTVNNYQGAVAFRGCTNIRAQRLELVGCYADGINLTGTVKSYVEDNYIHGAQGTLGSNSDIHLNGNAGVSCADNVIANNRCFGGANDFGIGLFQTSGGGAPNLRNKVIGNVVDQHAAYGILLYDAGTGADSYNIVANNTVQNIQGISGGNNNYGAGIYCANNGACSFIGNIIRNCCVTTAGSALLPAGIAINQTAAYSGHTVTGNQIFDMAQGNANAVPVSGIFISGSAAPGKGTVISGNHVSQQVAGGIQQGIYVINTNDVEVSGNQVNILNTIASVRGIFVYTAGNSESNIGVDNNNVLGCSVAAIQIYNNTGGVNLTCVSCNGNKVNGGASGCIGILAQNWIQGSLAGNVVNANNAAALNLGTCTQTCITGNSFNTSGANCVSLGGACTGSTMDESNRISGFPGTLANTATGMPVAQYGTASPAAGTFAVGDKVIQSAPTATAVYMWICTTAGAAPGTAVFKTISNT
jgi:hypothetical protein